jgi:hypothetical protein
MFPASDVAAFVSKMRLLLSTTLPTMDPVEPPAPICNVPAEIVVVPE